MGVEDRVRADGGAGLTGLPMLGLHAEPTSAMRHGQAWIEQCMSCGSLVGVIGSTNPDHSVRLDACPVCGSTNWKRQDVPVGPFSAWWSYFLVRRSSSWWSASPARILGWKP